MTPTCSGTFSRASQPNRRCHEAVVNEPVAFTVIRPSIGLRPIVVHVTYSSPFIPSDVRAQLLPDEAELARDAKRRGLRPPDRSVPGCGASMRDARRRYRIQADWPHAMILGGE